MKTIERYVITALVRDMCAAGYQVAAVHDGNGYWMHRRWCKRAPATIKEPLSGERAFTAIDSVDMCTLHFTDQNSTAWGDHGVLIILGNGEDCLSDSHSHEGEPFNGIIDAIYGKLNRGALLGDDAAIDALAHCERHIGLEYDCIDCMDALQAVLKRTGEPS